MYFLTLFYRRCTSGKLSSMVILWKSVTSKERTRKQAVRINTFDNVQACEAICLLISKKKKARNTHVPAAVVALCFDYFFFQYRLVKQSEISLEDIFFVSHSYCNLALWSMKFNPSSNVKKHKWAFIINGNFDLP